MDLSLDKSLWFIRPRIKRVFLCVAWNPEFRTEWLNGVTNELEFKPLFYKKYLLGVLNVWICLNAQKTFLFLIKKQFVLFLKMSTFKYEDLLLK